MEFTDIAIIDINISNGTMKKFEIGDHELLIANTEGKFYAIDDQRGHMNVSLSGGKLVDHAVQYPLHKAEYDLETGKKVKDPHIPGLLAKIGWKN